jgi:uncharacterized protein
MSLNDNVLVKFETLKQMIKEKSDGFRNFIVLFSGGLDSTLLAKLAQDIIGDKAVAVFIDDESVPSYIKDRITTLSKQLGLNIKIISFNILNFDDFTKNDTFRCYYCKYHRGLLIKKLFPESLVADGTNIDDLNDYRPGLKAAKELGIWHPYVDAGITKNDIREYAKYIGLPIWNVPSESCLASRVFYGMKLSIDLLRQIDKAETYLRNLGFKIVRARIFPGNLLKIEVGVDELDKLLDPQLRETIVNYMKELGFSHVTLDLEGYISGKMNRNVKQK